MTILIDIALKSTMILAAAWLATALMRRRTASARHMVWCVSLAALAALPILTVVLPSFEFPVPASLAAVTGPVYSATVIGGAAGAAESPSATTQPASRRASARPSLTWQQWVLTVWAAGAAAMLVHLLCGFLLMARLRRKAVPLAGPAWRTALAEAASILGVTRAVRLLESPRAGVPMAIGVLRPSICLPPSAREWDEERRGMVLLHELAHVLRGDPMTHLAARIALCLYWFHPLAWLAAREFLRERECACDDLVLAAGARPSRYAGHLLEVATSLTSPAAGWAALSMARRSQLEGRLVAILDSGVKRGAAGPVFAAAAALAVVMLVVPLAAMRPAAEVVPPSTAAEMDALIRAALSARDHAMLDRTAAALVARHKFAEAERIAAAALEVRAARYGENSREYAEGLVEEGKVRRAAGKMKEAEESYQKALALQPSGAAATLGFLALAAQHRRDYTKAVDLYRQALALQPVAEERGRLLTGLASAQQQLDDRVAAEQNYRAAISLLDPGAGDHALALELLSRLLTDMGRADEAKPLETRAAEIRAAMVRGSDPPRGHQAPTYRMGGGVSAPRLIYKVEPKYSEMARVAKHEGRVVLYAEIDLDGRAHNIKLVRGLGLGLDEQAAEAVRQWKFQPGYKDGQPVVVAATIEVNFRLM